MPARERFRQAAALGEQNRGSLMRKLLKVSNQMRLIVVAAIDRKRSPPRRVPSDRTKNLLKAKNEQLWSQPDLYQEPSF